MREKEHASTYRPTDRPTYLPTYLPTGISIHIYLQTDISPACSSHLPKGARQPDCLRQSLHGQAWKSVELLSALLGDTGHRGDRRRICQHKWISNNPTKNATMKNIQGGFCDNMEEGESGPIRHGHDVTKKSRKLQHADLYRSTQRVRQQKLAYI